MSDLEIISVIVPIYNVEKYITGTIESILAQSYHNLEVILVDDGSTDKSGKICDWYAKNDKRIKVIHKENGGVSSARNLGLDSSQGDFITYVDGDDFIHPQMIEFLFNAIMKTNTELTYVKQKRVNECYDLYRPKISPFIYSEGHVQVFKGNNLFKKIYSHEYTNIIVATTKLLKRDIAVSIRFLEGRINEDEQYVPRLLQRVKMAALVDFEMYYYVLREGSLSKAGLSENCRNKLDCMYENTFYFRRLPDEYAYNMEAVRYLKAIIYFSRQYCKKEYLDFRQVKILRKEFQDYFNSNKLDIYDKKNIIHFMLYQTLYFVYLTVLNLIKND